MLLSAAVIFQIATFHSALINTKHLQHSTPPDTVKEPFYVAEVIDNDIHKDVLTIRWFTATKQSLIRCVDQFHEMFYELELEQIAQKGKQKGPTRYRLEPIVQDVKYESCYFGFSKLRDDTGGLYPEVQRAIRSNTLIPLNVKISRK